MEVAMLPFTSTLSIYVEIGVELIAQIRKQKVFDTG